MSEAIYLEPDKVAGLEPSEGDARNLTMLSPFAVPNAAILDISEDGLWLAGLIFKYSGGETGAPPDPLDDLDDPRVTISTGRHTHKILELRFSPPLGRPSLDVAADLRRVAQRLTTRADTISRPAQRLSYIMISRIIEAWSDVIAQKAIHMGRA
jgi:hypothetical protein